MPCAHHLLRLALAAIRRAPERPFIARADRIQRVPELGCDSGIRGIFYHAHAFAVLNFPSDLASELKVISTIIDGPRPIGFHQNAVVRGGNELFKCQWFLARQQADVGHANHRQTVPAFGTQRSSGAIFAYRMRRLSRTQIAGKQSARDDRSTLRGDAFIVVGKCSEAGTVLLAGVCHHVDQIAAVTQRAQFFQRKKGSAREVCFHAKNAIEFDGMADGFVNLQSQLRTIKDDIEPAFGALIGVMQCNGFFRDATSVLQQLQFFDQFVSFILPLPAVRIRIRTFLNFISRESVSGVSRAGRIFRLMDVASF